MTDQARLNARRWTDANMNAYSEAMLRFMDEVERPLEINHGIHVRLSEYGGVELTIHKSAILLTHGDALLLSRWLARLGRGIATDAQRFKNGERFEL